MFEPTLVIFTSYLAQSAGAVVFALVLASFHRLFRRNFLLTWAWSWWALCVHLLAYGVSASVLDSFGGRDPLLFAASATTTVAGFWSLTWVLLGTREAVTGRATERRTRLVALAVALVAALATVLGTIPVRPGTGVSWRIGLRALVAGLVYIAAGVTVWRAERHSGSLGRRMLGTAFLLYAGNKLASLLSFVDSLNIPFTVTYVLFLGPFDLLLQIWIGVSMVSWLLEDERQAVITASARIEHLAYHDALTDLPNRNRLVDQLLAALPGAQRGGERMAVLSLDLDRFKVINDSLGHRSGDEILCSMAERLRRGLRPKDVVARLGGDEFVLLLRGVGSEADLVRTAETLLAVVRLPFVVGGREVHVSASLGLSRFPEDGADPEELLKRADIAMYQAKEQGRGHYQVYAPTMDAHNLEQLSLENDLRKALGNQEFVLYYQPVLNCHTRGVDSVEALLRWQHPKLGLLRPGQFLWLAEATGLTDALDLWVLRTACRQIVTWQSEGVPRLRVAVNLSARPFQSRDLLERVKDVLAETTLSPSSLEIEITETLAMQNAEASLAVLRGIKELGVRISIDDFGTGFSSLSYLTNFPIDTLKVDASFVKSLGGGRGSEEVVAAVIALAHSLDIDVVAEGVEEEQQWQALRELGCDKVQGYLFSHPLPPDDAKYLVVHGDAQKELLPAG